MWNFIKTDSRTQLFRRFFSQVFWLFCSQDCEVIISTTHNLMTQVSDGTSALAQPPGNASVGQVGHIWTTAAEADLLLCSLLITDWQINKINNASDLPRNYHLEVEEGKLEVAEWWGWFRARFRGKLSKFSIHSRWSQRERWPIGCLTSPLAGGRGGILYLGKIQSRSSAQCYYHAKHIMLNAITEPAPLHWWKRKILDVSVRPPSRIKIPRQQSEVSSAVRQQGHRPFRSSWSASTLCTPKVRKFFLNIDRNNW